MANRVPMAIEMLSIDPQKMNNNSACVQDAMMREAISRSLASLPASPGARLDPTPLWTSFSCPPLSHHTLDTISQFSCHTLCPSYPHPILDMEILLPPPLPPRPCNTTASGGAARRIATT